MENLILLLLCLVAYFLFEFKTKSNDAEFNFGYWIKDNWINLALYVVIGGIFYIFRGPELSKGEIIAIGFAPNLLVDWIQTFRYNQKLKTT